MFRHASAFVFASSLALPLAAADAPAAREVLAADAARTTPSGATFTAPAGWTMRGERPARRPRRRREPDSHLVLVDVRRRRTRTRRSPRPGPPYRPEAKRPLRLATPGTARSGWEERQRYDYETSPNERATVVRRGRVARGHVRGWCSFVDATDPTFEKRGAPSLARDQEPPPQGLSRETFAGKKAHPLDAARIADDEGLRRARGMEHLGVPGVGLRVLDGGQGRLRRRARRARSSASPTGRRRHALHRRVEHEGDDDAPARRARRREEAALGPARHGGLSGVQAGRRGDDEAGPREAPRLRLHGPAAAGPGVALRVPERDASLGARRSSARCSRRAASARSSSTATSWRRRPATSAAAVAFPGRELGAAYDEAMRTKIFEPLGMTHTTFDFARALSGQRRAAALRRRRPEAHGRARMDLNESVDPGPAGRRRLDERARPLQVRPDGARAGEAPGGKRLISEENLLARRAPQSS